MEFAGRGKGLDRDRDAVIAALTLPYSNSPTEGVNTKTKRIARQMHGRADFTLLRRRILLEWQHAPTPPNVRQGRSFDRPPTGRPRPSPAASASQTAL